MYFFSPILAWIIAQSLKVIIEFWKNKKLNIKRILDSGGMPSSHAALTVALTTSLWRDFGAHDPKVGIAAVFTLVVLYDATGVRRETGRQAEILNKLIDEVKSFKSISNVRLRVLLGHTPLQVLAGMILGVFIGYYM